MQLLIELLENLQSSTSYAAESWGVKKAEIWMATVPGSKYCLIKGRIYKLLDWTLLLLISVCLGLISELLTKVVNGD